MKRICLFAGLLTATSCAMSAEFGFGVGVGQSTRTIYAPINVTPGLRVEPYLSFGKTTTTSSGGSDSMSASLYGVGLFATRLASENTSLLAGLRMAYRSDKYDRAAQSDGYSSSNSSHSSGYLLAPTIGFEFFLQKNISLGAEAAIVFSRTSGRNASTYTSQSTNSDTGADTKTRTRDTSTAVTLKYYF